MQCRGGLTSRVLLITVEIMSPLSSSLSPKPLDAEDIIESYRAVSSLAVAGLILGLCSVVALIHPVLWLVPLVGIAIDCMALRQIAMASPPLLGRKAVLIGMTLSLIFGIAAPIQYGAHRRALRAEAIELAEEFFTVLRENRPDYALRLTRQPTTKTARTKPPMAMPSMGEDALASVRKFTQEQPAELLLKVGKRAHVRLYQHGEVWRDESTEGVRDTYVVTVDEETQPVSFFVKLGCTRSQDLATGEWQWQISKNEFVSYPTEELLERLESSGK